MRYYSACVALVCRLPYPVPFKFLPAGEAAAWIDTAYLSPRLRVSDGNKGTRFVLKRVGS